MLKIILKRHRMISKISVAGMVLTFFTGCYYEALNEKYKQYIDCTTVECVNDGLPYNATAVDSLDYEKMYNAFMAAVDTSARTNEQINSMLLEFEVVDKLKTIIKKETGTCSFTFSVSPEGVSKIYNNSTQGSIDTVGLRKINDKICRRTPLLSPAPGLWVNRSITYQNKMAKTGSANVYSDRRVARSKESVIEVVMNRIQGLKTVYNRRLYAMPGIKGKLTVKFAIDQYGKVVFAGVVASTVNDTLLENAVAAQIARWNFKPVLSDGDITEVVYPFIFSQ